MSKDILSTLKEPINSILSELSAEAEQYGRNRILEYQHEEFERNIEVKTILHRTKPVGLYSIYQPLFLVEKWTTKNLKEWKYEKISTDSVSELFKERKFLTVIGTAGSGKSMLVKHLYVNCIREKFKIPIKIELRYLNEFEGSFTDYIFKKIFREERLGSSDRIIDNLLESGKFVFFLDGYDELKSVKVSRVAKQVNDFVRRYNSNNYLLTSRPYTNIDTFPMFTNHNVCELENEEIEVFIRKQIPELNKELSEKIIAAISRNENNSYRSFLSNPLLLSMFILSFQSYAEIPQYRSTFYRQVFDTLYSMHDSMSKLAYVREKKSKLSKEQFESVLEMFSLITFLMQSYYFSADEIYSIFKYIKRNKKDFSFDNDKLLSDLTVAIAILSKEGTDYTFPHRSLQEYFAARYITNLSPPNKRKIYNKVFSKFMVHSDTGFWNFFVILNEVDKKDFLRRLVLPALSTLAEKFSKESLESYDRSEILRLFASDYWLVNTLLWESVDYDSIDTQQSEIMDEFNKIIEERKEGEISEDDYKAQFLILDKKIKDFCIEVGEFIIVEEDKKDNYLTDENSGDANIIDIL